MSRQFPKHWYGLNKSVPRLSHALAFTPANPEPSKESHFARDQDIDLYFSIDGPSDLHDRKRIYTNGNGSFAAVNTLGSSA